MWNKRHDVLLDTSKFRASLFPYEITNDYLNWFSKISPKYSNSSLMACSVPSSSSSSAITQMARLRELLHSICEDKRSPGGFEDNEIYHYVVDECIKFLREVDGL
ncbi:hypothetical protein LIER_34406 [Lithospermum erythrorhizon]|uniref:Uncharacterized protein n=1 Tax=Lithospermum erythrorhizon TaxID=34254 RepID=A0AAV3S1A0_LITER